MRTLFSSPVRRRWLGRVLLASGCAIALAALPVAKNADPSSDVARLEHELADVRSQIAERGAANARLRSEISALKNDPHAIERAGRDQLGLVYPSEIVVRIRDGAQPQ